jgi:hypothetical protein
VNVSFANNYTPSPIPPQDLPALTIWKVFHGLTNAEIPSGFQLRITGPGGFARTINASQAIAGVTYRNLALGQYTITETGSNVPGFNMTVKINDQEVSLPFTFTIDRNTGHIALVIDNFYTPEEPPGPPPSPPPSPQTGTRGFTMPVIIFMLGAIIIGLSEVYRRKNKNKN